MDPETTCVDCTMPLNDKTKCACDETKCVHCCACGEGCSCDCKAKSAAANGDTDEEEEGEDETLE